jgi:apolipoprotein D and lipocalin family protein
MKNNYFKKIKLFVSIILLLITSNTQTMAQTLETVPYVNLEKYAGKWFEISSFPQRWQKKCSYTTATYTLSEKGYVIVNNSCRKDDANGKQIGIKGKAFVDDNSGNAKLKVQFFWPFKGKYWIIDLADDYSYTVVGNPNRKYLWILSRTPAMDETTYQKIISKLIIKGFDTSKLKRTKQI